MKNKIIRIFLLALIAALSLASCGETTGDGCEHTFAETWSSDATNHWHAATCEHGEVKDALAAHVDVDEDGKCDDCEYEVGHTHSYADNWSVDETSHWKAPTCTHASEKVQLSLHVDDDTDGKCDVCEGHVHTLDSAGFCKECDKEVKPIDETSISSVVSALVARRKNIISGKVDYTNLITSSVTGGVVATVAHTSEYIFGTNATYINRTMLDMYDRTVLEENWIPRGEGDNIIGISTVKQDGVLVDAQSSAFGADTLRGYYFVASTLADGYGPENLLYNLYNLSVESGTNIVSDVTVTQDVELNSCVYSYNILVINTDTAEGEDDGVNYFEVSVSFEYADDYTLLKLDAKVDCYTNSLADENEHDYTYDQATKTITMKPNASADTYHYVVEQAKGDKKEIEVKDGSEFVPTGLKLFTDSDCTIEAETVFINLGEFDKELYIGCTPSGTFVEFLSKKMKIKVTNKYGVTVSTLMATLVGDVIQLLPNATGEFVVTVTSGDIICTVNVNVVAEEVKGEHKIELVASDSNSWTDVYDFKATATGTYTFYCPRYGVGIWEKDAFDYADSTIGNNQSSGSGSSGNISYTGPYVDYQDPNSFTKSFTVELEAGETFSFYYMLAEKGKPFTIGYDFKAN